MLHYDEFSSFRTPPKSVPRGPKPASRIEALDDLHRTLYGSLHPSAAIVESDNELVEGDAESEGVSWLESNALTAAIALVGAFAVYSWMQRGKTAPLKGPADAPLPPTTSPPA